MNDLVMDDDPRLVLRGSNLHLLFLGVDSLYLMIEYPHVDMFQFWLEVVGDVQDNRLYQGLVYENFVLRKGGLGYSLSVWQGDARLFLTERVSDTLQGSSQADQGMGMLLQLGPKWLQTKADLKNGDNLRQAIYEQLEAFGLCHPQQYPMRLNRMDIALDIGGLRTETISIDEWREHWVGYAKPRKIHFSPVSGQIEGLSIGSYQGSVCFKLYNKVAQSVKDHDLEFWLSVWGQEDFQPVARLEWSIKPYQAKFAHCTYLTDYTYDKLLALLNYASLKWGRLCLPDPANANTVRWELAPLWVQVRGMIEVWSDHYSGVAKRDYHLTPDISPSYLASFAGWVAGLEARIGVEYGYLEAASLRDVFDYLAQSGMSSTDIQIKADGKWALFKILGGK